MDSETGSFVVLFPYALIIELRLVTGIVVEAPGRVEIWCSGVEDISKDMVSFVRLWIVNRLIRVYGDYRISLTRSSGW